MSIQQQMVGDLYGLAEKAQSPDQIKAVQAQIAKSIKDGAIPAYAGVPLVQDLTARLQKAAQAQQIAAAQMQPQAPQQPPIAGQIMAQVGGLDNLPSNLPADEQAYAAGGIVAFASGDLVDEEDDDDKEEANLLALMGAARDRIQAGLGSAGARLTAALPQSYEKEMAAKAPAPTKTVTTSDVSKSIFPGAPSSISEAGKGTLSNLLSSAASKYSVPVALLNRISGAESGGSPTAANPRSSAKGVFQFTDTTWKGMGGKPGEQFDPEANVDLGAKYIRQNAEHLKKTLGRDPTYHEVYAAHMFGPGVSKMLNKANPKDPIESGLALFESPQMVKKIMKANPNLRGKSVGQVLDSLESKTGQGIVALAHGGAVKRFFAGGMDEDIYSPEGVLVSGPTTRTPIEKPEWEKEWERLYLKKPAPTAEDRLRQEQMEYQDLIEGPAGRNLVRPEPKVTPEEPPKGGAGVGVGKKEEKEEVDPYLEKYMSMLQKRESQAEKQKQVDAYMAIMQAGLGMMASRSPYALAGIGEGGMQGLASYAASQKQRGAEEAATLAGYGKLYTAKQAADLRRDLAAQNKDLAIAKMGQEKENKIMSLIAGREKQLETVAYNNVIKAIGNAFTDMTPEQKTMAINAETQRLKSRDQLLSKWYADYGLPPIEPTKEITAVPDYAKIYGLTPKK